MRAELEQRFRQVFTELADVPDEEWQFFWSHVQEQRFKSGAHLFRDGKPARAIHYLLSGLVRIYHNVDGAELVRGFDYEGRFVAVFESILTGDPSGVNVQALEPTHTLWFPGAMLKHLYERHLCWERVGRKLLEQQWLRRQDKEARFRIYSPEAHYRLLLERRSPLVSRVPLRQLASYLQIAPETLSRIRARLRKGVSAVDE
ncbi:MAG TPA: Crp/Fnr family transcriptional regulator [Gemmatimonadaceae bacterium]|nr:Crp/Fnr family transcriptional regulator [Gemmatimonadaceae bacterium]